MEEAPSLMDKCTVYNRDFKSEIKMEQTEKKKLTMRYLMPRSPCEINHIDSRDSGKAPRLL